MGNITNAVESEGKHKALGSDLSSDSKKGALVVRPDEEEVPANLSLPNSLFFLAYRKYFNADFWIVHIVKFCAIKRQLETFSGATAPHCKLCLVAQAVADTIYIHVLSFHGAIPSDSKGAQNVEREGGRTLMRDFLKLDR